jgi:CheY-like chemotaxis protein
VSSGTSDDAAVLVAALRSGPGARGLPVVLLAARPARALQQLAKSAGACAVVSKPLTGPRLRAAIASVLPA